MHSQMERLYLAACELKGLKGQTQVALAIGVSPQTINNWESRGVSQRGLMASQAALGCNAQWVESGKGNMRLVKAPAVSASGNPLPLAESLDTLATYCGTLDLKQRREVAELLAVLAVSQSESIKHDILAVFGESSVDTRKKA
jgi:transcriptional regulator with XRE-family HTH domain